LCWVYYKEPFAGKELEQKKRFVGLAKGGFLTKGGGNESKAGVAKRGKSP